MTRRVFLRNAAGAVALAGAGSPAVAQQEPYQFGCETLPYRAQTFERALEGIRKAGYKYVMPTPTHAAQATSPAALRRASWPPAL
jgi:hypothetical protein